MRHKYLNSKVFSRIDIAEALRLITHFKSNCVSVVNNCGLTNTYIQMNLVSDVCSLILPCKCCLIKVTTQ